MEMLVLSSVLVLWCGVSAADNLRATDLGYVAEWQWEQWPQQVVPGAINTTRTPGPRQSTSLWYDQSAMAWWMFGGRQIPNTTSRYRTTPKIYSDFWRYDTRTRTWSRIFPNDSRKINNNGGLQLLRTSLYNEGHLRKQETIEPSVILCGRSEGKKLVDRSLAIYGPRSKKSNTVWQFESKDRLWTTYLCCCDSTDRTSGNKSVGGKNNRIDESRHTTKMPELDRETTMIPEHSVETTKITGENRETTKMPEDNRKTTKAEDGEKKMIEGEKDIPKIDEKEKGRRNEQHIEMDGEKLIEEMRENEHTFEKIKENRSRKKLIEKFNKTKNSEKQIKNIEFENKYVDTTINKSKEDDNLETLGTSDNATDNHPNKTERENSFPTDDVSDGPYNQEIIDITSLEFTNMTQDVDTYLQEMANTTERHGEEQSSDVTRHVREVPKVRDTAGTDAFCPDFQAGDPGSRPKGQPVAWCDTSRELLVALDIQASPLILWQFDLKSSHWTQHKISLESDTLWPGCASNTSLRYSSAGSTVYVLCPPYGQAATTPTRHVYRIDASLHRLQAVGQLQLNTVFGSGEGDTMWADETRTVLQVIETEQQTLLLVAYNRLLDIWVLSTKNRQTGLHILVPVENIWRGSALKWFRGYSAPFYNLQVDGVTYLMANPRPVGQYWPRDRGSFIIRLLDSNDNNNNNVSLKVAKQAYHVMPGEAKNSTLVPLHHQGQTGIKALLFFAFSLTLFAVFGLVLFVRRCVTCPPRSWRLRGDDSNKATPPVIRYSVIPEDHGYPVA